MATAILGVRAWLLILSLLSSIPLFAFAGYATYRLAQAEQTAILTNLVQRNDAAARSVQQRLQSWSTLLTTLARSQAAIDGDLRSFYDHAVRMKGLYPDIAGISPMIGPATRCSARSVLTERLCPPPLSRRW